MGSFHLSYNKRPKHVSHQMHQVGTRKYTSQIQKLFTTVYLKQVYIGDSSLLCNFHQNVGLTEIYTHYKLIRIMSITPFFGRQQSAKLFKHTSAVEHNKGACFASGQCKQYSTSYGGKRGFKFVLYAQILQLPVSCRRSCTEPKK